MQWLLILRPKREEMLVTGPTPEEMQRVQEHFDYWAELTRTGTALIVGRTQTTDPGTIGLAIFAADDEPAANDLVGRDPGVVHGVFSAELRPYKVALLGDPQAFRPA